MQQEDQQPQIPAPGQATLHRVSAKEFAAKFQSKRECYNFLAVQVEVYLPAYETVTIYFLKDIISGKKKRKCNDAIFFQELFIATDVRAKSVRTIVVPHYEGLAIKDMDAQIFRSNEQIYAYLPDRVEIHKTPK